MGMITDKVQDESDSRQLRNLAEMMPAYKRFLAHHLRNSLQSILNHADAVREKGKDPANLQTILYSVEAIEAAAEHMVEDLERSGL